MHSHGFYSDENNDEKSCSLHTSIQFGLDQTFFGNFPLYAKDPLHSENQSHHAVCK